MGLLRRLQGESPRREDFGYDLGVLYYWYPGNYSNAPSGYTKPDTTELYAALTWKFLRAQVQLERSTDVSACPDSRKTDGSSYLDLTASYDVRRQPDSALRSPITAASTFGHLGRTQGTAATRSPTPRTASATYGDWLEIGAVDRDQRRDRRHLTGSPAPTRKTSTTRTSTARGPFRRPVRRLTSRTRQDAF